MSSLMEELNGIIYEDGRWNEYVKNYKAEEKIRNNRFKNLSNSRTAPHRQSPVSPPVSPPKQPSKTRKFLTGGARNPFKVAAGLAGLAGTGEIIRQNVGTGGIAPDKPERKRTPAEAREALRSAAAERLSKSTDTKTEEPTPEAEQAKRRLSPNMIKGGGAALAAGLGGLALARYLRRRKKKAEKKKD